MNWLDTSDSDDQLILCFSILCSVPLLTIVDIVLTWYWHRKHKPTWFLQCLATFVLFSSYPGYKDKARIVHVMYVLWNFTSCLCAGGLYGYLSQSGCTENDPSYRLHPEERSAAGLWWWGQEEEEETTSHKTVRPWCYKVTQRWYQIGKWQSSNLLVYMIYSSWCTYLQVEGCHCNGAGKFNFFSVL